METTHDKEMHMKTRNLFSGILMMAMVAGAAGTQNPKENPAQDRRLNDLEYLSKSKREVTAISTGVDALLKTVNEAKASNDPAKMKAALEASSKHLGEMKEHAANCMKHMEHMEAMEAPATHSAK